MKTEAESLHFDHISAVAGAFPKKQQQKKKKNFYLCPNTSGRCNNAAGRRGLHRDCWCTRNSPAATGSFSFISGRMCLQRSHSPGEHLYQITLSPDSCTGHDARHSSSRCSAALVRCIFYVYCLLKTFVRTFRGLKAACCHLSQSSSPPPFG